MTTHSMYSTVSTCNLQYLEYVCLVLLFQHEKYRSQLQMSLKPSEGKKSDVDEQARKRRVPRASHRVTIIQQQYWQ